MQTDQFGERLDCGRAFLEVTGSARCLDVDEQFAGDQIDGDLVSVEATLDDLDDLFALSFDRGEAFTLEVGDALTDAWAVGEGGGCCRVTRIADGLGSLSVRLAVSLLLCELLQLRIGEREVRFRLVAEIAQQVHRRSLVSGVKKG